MVRGPSVIFVVELDRHILLYPQVIDCCVFPAYRFDVPHRAYEAADNIAIETGKKVASTVGYPNDSPMIYDPADYEEIEAALTSLH